MKSLLPSLPALLMAAGLFAVPARAQETAPASEPPKSLTLEQTLDAVLARYPSVDAAQAAVDAARARVTQSNSDRQPQVAAQGNYLYSSIRPYVAFGGGAFYEEAQDTYGASVTVRQLLTDFGRTDALIALSRTGELSARDALEQTRHQLGYQTIQAFYGIVLLRQSVGVHDEEIKALDEALRIAQRKFGAGSATRFDVLTTQVRLVNARNRRTDTLAALAKQEALLGQLLGYAPGTPLPVEGDFDPSRPAPDLATALAQGLENRPEMKLAHDDEEMSRHRLEAAQRANRPRLDAQATGGVGNGYLPDLYDHMGYLTAGVAFNVPIFTGHRLTGEKIEANANLRSSEGRIRELHGVIATDIQDALSDLTSAQDHLASADTLVDQAEEALALAKTRYANGVITNFELLDAQSAARGAELNRLQARYDRVLAWQAVERAAGHAPQP